jgi:hypothetical protein
MKTRLIICLLALLLPAIAVAEGGQGTVRIGYIYTDDEGNASTSYRAYNEYEGGALSFENFCLDLNNGVRLTATARNLTLNNRNVSLALNQTKKFGVTVNNSVYRRIYSFEGNNFTRRRSTSGTFYVIPHPWVRLYGGGQWVTRNGFAVPLFDVAPVGLHPAKQVDGRNDFYHAGVRLANRGASVNAELRTNTYVNNLNTDLDQKRIAYRVDAQLPIPTFEQIILTGGFRRYESKFDKSGFAFSANTGWGGVTAAITPNFSARGTVVLDRAKSDSDFVAADNMTVAGYLTYATPRTSSFTVGYQFGTNDDFDNEIRSNAWYFSGWYTASRLELRGDVGLRAEEVREGSRFIGDEDRNRYRGKLTWRIPESGKLQFSVENRTRENIELESSTDFTRFGVDGDIELWKDWKLAGSYSHAKGTYTNSELPFEFTDDVVSGDVTLPEYRRLTLSGGVVYYRSGKDIDIESVSIRTTADYQIGDFYHLNLKYDGHNYDDLKMQNMYYTANIIELTIAREVSF